jgi:hypothetical protein
MARLQTAALLVTLSLLGACTTKESAAPTSRCRASTSDGACRACCTETPANDRTNSYNLNAPGDCRCILRFWLFLQ